MCPPATRARTLEIYDAAATVYHEDVDANSPKPNGSQIIIKPQSGGMTFPALLVGGFGLPPQLYSRLARDLDARIAPTRLTIGCGEVEVRKVQRALEAFDEPVALVGHSRGGQIARVVAARMPESVHVLLTVGTPSAIGPPQRWGVPVVASAMRRLRVPFALDCAEGECCAAFRADLARPVRVPWTAIWSPTDRIVPPVEARHAGADLVEVTASHVGLVTTERGRAAIARALPGR